MTHVIHYVMKGKQNVFYFQITKLLFLFIRLFNSG